MVEYLGFIIDSEKKITYLLDQKKKKKIMRNFTSFQRITIYADALFEGWGPSMGNVSTGGIWLLDEKLKQVNALQLKTI